MRRLLVLSVGLLSSLLLPLSLGADDGLPPPPSGIGTVVITQKTVNEGGPLGTWTLIVPSGTPQNGTTETVSFSQTPTGVYTLIATPPKGYTAAIFVRHGDGTERDVPRGQATFTLDVGDTVSLTITYQLKYMGLVTVDSNPTGLLYTLVGPNNFSQSGVTPAAFHDVPEGQYSVSYETLPGCRKIPQKSINLVAKSRISFSIKLECEAADAVRASQKAELIAPSPFVETGSGDTGVILTDVPREAWYAESVYYVARLGVIAGYKDANGRLNGTFGPDRPVTVAELSAIAHRMAGFSVEGFTETDEPNRPSARWYTPYIASARSRGWTLFFSSDLSPLRPATRSEVLVTLLQVMEVPLQWQKGKTFTDVELTTPYASAIETAAAQGLVTGKKTADGTPLHLFGPADPVTRAEMSQIVATMMKKYRGNGK